MQLTRLGMHFNELAGRIPESLGKLVQSNHRDLGSHKLTVGISESLGRRVLLTYLNLGLSKLTGVIP